MEASDEKRDEYAEQIKHIDKKKIVYIDESGIEMGIRKNSGWGLKNEKLFGKKSGKYHERKNIIAGLINGKIIAPMVYECTCNTEFFNKWVETALIKELEPGQVVVMDNISFHKSPQTRKLIESERKHFRSKLQVVLLDAY